MTQQVLITGANGRIGRHVVEALVKAGYSLRAATPASFDGLGVRWVPVDFLESVDYDKLVEGVDVIVHLAAELWDTSKMEAVNTGATASLAEAAEKAGVGLFIYTSTVAVYGFPTCRRLTETSPTLPIDPRLLMIVPYLAPDFMKIYSVTKLRGEVALKGSVNHTKAITLRLANVVTEADIATVLDWNFARRIWRGRRATHQVYVKDVAAAIEFFLERYVSGGLSDLATHETFIVSQDTDPPSTYADLFRRFDRARGSTFDWHRLCAPSWMDRLKDSVKFRRIRVGWPFGAQHFSPAKLLGAGFQYRFGVTRVQDDVIARLIS